MNNPSFPPALVLKNIVRTYHGVSGDLSVLRGVDLVLQPGEIVALVAPSGAGKSTLLHTAGLLEQPQSGDMFIQGQQVTAHHDAARTALRRSHIGFVYQFHHLLPEFSAVENIMLPQMLAGVGRAAALLRAQSLLDQVGLLPRAQHRPAELSGGEQQRVAIARALANRPAILLADEPTGNLDPATAEPIFDLLVQLARHEKLAALMATHNHDLARRMDRIVRLADGVLVAG